MNFFSGNRELDNAKIMHFLLNYKSIYEVFLESSNQPNGAQLKSHTSRISYTEKVMNYFLGAFESGMAAKFMGLVPSVAFGGVMTLLVVVVTARINPVLRRLSLKN